MNDITAAADSSAIKPKKSAARKGKLSRMAPAATGEILVKGVVMGIIISGITHASKSLTGTLARHPLSFFSIGLVTGYLMQKHRKEIIAIGCRTAEESKNFVLRQKENISDMIAEAMEDSEEKGVSK